VHFFIRIIIVQSCLEFILLLRPISIYELEVISSVSIVLLNKLLEVWVRLDLFIGAFKLNLTILQADYRISVRQKVKIMADQDTSFFGQFAHHDLFEDSFLNSVVYGSQGVIHQDALFVCVYGACQADASFLAVFQVDALFSDLSLVTTWQQIKVSLQLANLDCLLVLHRIVSRTKQDVFLDSLILDPGTLLDQRHGLGDLNRGAVWVQLPFGVSQQFILDIIDCLGAMLLVEWLFREQHVICDAVQKGSLA